MSLSVLKNENLNRDELLIEILRESLNAEVIESMVRFAQTLRYYGYEVPVYSQQSLLRLNETDTAKKIQIRDYFRNWNQWIQPLAEDGPGQPSRSKEITFAKRALDHYQMTISDEFWTAVGPEDVMEIYGPDMIQLYRSLNFFKYCGYSLLDISVYEWFVLWERPRLVIEKMSHFGKIVLDSMVPIVKLDVPRHVLRETKNTGMTLSFKTRACIVQFKYIGSLCQNNSAKPIGIICTATGEVVAEGSDAMNIQFV